MKTNDSKNSRSENARNEARDSKGQFTSKDQSKSPHGSSKSTNHRGEDAKGEARDSHGRFTSEDKKKSSK